MSNATPLHLHPAAALSSSDRIWEEEIIPALFDYIHIPNLSPQFDAAWREHGHMERAVNLVERWCTQQPIPGMTVEVVRLERRTPLLFIEIPGQGPETVLLYGHLDKQPEMTGWREGLSPWKPVREGNKLYGRGGADDGYSAFASLAAIRLLQEQKVPHARCVVIIEAGEESGSPDLPAYIEALADRIGRPSLVICLDSGCGNYDALWSTTSLRGIIGGTLRVDVLTEGVHSGTATGVVASSFRVLRQLLSRIEDERTGAILLDELHVPIPEARHTQVAASAESLRHDVIRGFPWAPGMQPVHEDLHQLLLNRTWRPTLAITGADGLPPTTVAGNVLRPYTAVKISMRIPPGVDPHRATRALKYAFENDPPHGAQVTFTPEKAAAGWDAPPLSKWLGEASDHASRAFFGNPAMTMGEGGTIPFMFMLGEKFPAAEFLITGVLGPQSNAHGPNEFLDLAMGKRLTCCVASVIGAHFTSSGR